MSVLNSHLLILEDEPIIAELLKGVMERAGYRVTVVHGVTEGLAEVKKQAFDLCISDFLLPDRTGLDFVQGVRTLQPGLRFILVTAYLEPELAERVKAEPAIVAVVRKPMDVFELRSTVADLLEAQDESREKAAE